MASALTPLANLTISGSSTASVTFSSISSAYRDLMLVVSGTNSVDANLYFRLNGDSGSNYNATGMSGNGSSASPQGGNYSGIFFNANARIGTSAANFKLDFLDYSATDKHKTVLYLADRSDSATERWVSRWSNTAAISSIVGTVTSGNLVAGTTFALYGVSA
jgi:hypothetical protein